MSSSSSTSASTWPSWPKSTRGTSLLDVLLFKDGSITIEEDGIKTKTKSKSHDSSPSSSSSSSTMVDLLFDDLFGEKSPFQVRRRLFCCCLLALRGREMEGRGKRKEKDAVKKAMLFSLFSLACPLPKKKRIKPLSLTLQQPFYANQNQKNRPASAPCAAIATTSRRPGSLTPRAPTRRWRNC